MKISKKPTIKINFEFKWYYFNSARSGLKYILMSEELKDKKILIPAYIGYSPNEGSGVFNPIKFVKKDFIFYRIDYFLNIDVNYIIEKIQNNPSNIIFLIHYFGFKDKNIKLIKKYARKNNMIIIEDFAHAFFTFYKDPAIDFDFAIFSIHKLFPFDSGGMILTNKNLKYNKNFEYNLFRYNINGIIKKRISNYNYIIKILKKEKERFNIIILKEKLEKTVPQSFPILVKNRAIRDFLYFKMNEQGYGVVSLYHTLINEINKSYANEHSTSNRILNLPIHQDVDKDEIRDMLNIMFKYMVEINK